MRIAFFMNQIITGGIENILVNILRELKKSYPEIVVTVISLKKVTEKRFLDFFIENEIKLIDDNPLAPFTCTIYTRGIKGKIRKLVQRVKKIRLRSKLEKDYDLIVDYFNGSFSFLLRKVYKIPKICFLHLSTDAYYAAHKSVVREHLYVYDKVVTISKSFYNDLVVDFPDEKEKFEMIYNPVDCKYIKTLSKKCVIEKQKFFTCVARCGPEKDHKTLIYAFAKFLHAENYPNVKLYVLGEGPLLKEWQNLCVLLNIDTHVVFVGNVTNPCQYVSGAMANILPTFGEGLPTVLIEAQAVNTINIASNVKSGISEILLNGDGGLLFEPENAYDLAKNMSYVYHNKIDKQTMIKEAAAALNRFDVRSNVSKIYDLFTQIITKK